MDRLLSFGFKADFGSLVLICIGVLVGTGIYFAYVRSRMRGDLRKGLNPSGVRLGGIAFALTALGLVVSLASGVGFALLLPLFVLSLGLALAGRNRGATFVALCLLALAAFAVRLLFGH